MGQVKDTGGTGLADNTKRWTSYTEGAVDKEGWGFKSTSRGIREERREREGRDANRNRNRHGFLR